MHPSINCKVKLKLFVGDWQHAILFMGLCHMLRYRCIGQLYTIGWLLSVILGVVQKHLLFWKGLIHTMIKIELVEVHSYYKVTHSLRLKTCNGGINKFSEIEHTILNLPTTYHNTCIWKFEWLGDNCIQTIHLGRYIVGYMVGNLVLRWRRSRAIKRGFQLYILWYTSQNENEYGYPHSNFISNWSVASCIKLNFIQRYVTISDNILQHTL